MEMLHVYADESCTSGQKYLALGGIGLKRSLVEPTVARIQRVRETFGTHGEVKWQKVSKAKLDFYKAYVDVFFDASAKDEMSFRALYVDTHTFNHHRFNGGDSEIGFNKLIYQLLLHKFGRTYGSRHRLHVYLDHRATKQSPDYLRPMLNSHLAKWSVRHNPFRRIEFLDSKASELIQLNDLLVGVVGFLKNEQHKRPECAPHKIALSEYIVSRALRNEYPNRLDSQLASKFAVWPFAFEKR